MKLTVPFLILLGCTGCTAQSPYFTIDAPMAPPVDMGPLNVDVAPLPDLAVSLDLAPPRDMAAPPDLAPSCAGYVAPEIKGCWYVGSHASCNAICKTHGGFDAPNSVHYGDPILKHFYPNAKLTNTTGYIEWCTIESGVMYRWPANGLMFAGSTVWDYDCVVCSCNE